jgi:hypothetical protein
MSNLTPEEQKKVELLREHYNLLIRLAGMIAVLPIDKWLADFDQAETMAPYLDPTLYREYLARGSGEDIKKVLRASLELKRTVEDIQTKAKAKAS